MYKLYGVLAQVHLLVSEMANTSKIFGPVFVSCDSLENHTSAVYAFMKLSVFLIQHMLYVDFFHIVWPACS